MNEMIRTLLVITTCLIYNISYGQSEVKIHIGNGFDSLEFTLIVTYFEKKEFKEDTLMKKEFLQSDVVTGLTKSFHYNFPRKTRKGRKGIRLILNDERHSFRFDKIRNKSEFRIENLGGIDILLLQKGEFIFY